MIANDFKSINKILNRHEQKAEFEANNPNVEQSVYGYLHGAVAPFDMSNLRATSEQLVRQLERFSV